MKSQKKNQNEQIGFIGLVATLAVNGWFLSCNAFRGFNIFDMGAFLDGGWRVYKGQIPYIDFMYFTGPIHLYLQAFFFQIFNFSKEAILAHLIAISSLVTFATFLLSRHFVSTLQTLLVTLLTATCFYWPISHPWYDQTAHLWGILATVLLVLSLKEGDSGRNNGTSFFIGILTGLSFLSKSNIGLAYIFIFTITFFFTCNKKICLMYLVGTISTVLIILLLLGVPDKYFNQAFLNYAFVQSTFFQKRRLLYILTPISWFRNYYWLIGLIVIWACKKHVLQFKRELFIFVGILFVGVFSILTGSMLRDANVPLWGLACALGFILISKVAPKIKSKEKHDFKRGVIWLSVLTSLFILKSIVYGLELKVWSYSGSPFGDYPLKTKALQGWMFQKEDGEDIDIIVQFLKQVPKEEQVLVLSDLQIIYALSGRDSYKGVPFMFSEKDIPAPGEQLETVRQHIIDNPPDWIITHRFKRFQVTFIIQYLRLRDWVVQNYEPVQKWNNYAILKRKKK
ncbi:MAG: hypothetical protein COV74_08235 [Candidatus Omnitrophica bacterium CG11_big_fil_rev_8_21_14_0_20_45_26]|uniref:Uncharacterized protein n=1 Tax=Candidatus Abzuiibacterium crystallinum TaxID=1974748 RepID=A0A2H0LM88_9BACT|nr:MAG: hypothetical protein COV74_08235 [Candidatus Omnitrophica bacterium CG11_big_fil_rev_8_21_14_0_20_45_26]PIW63649.1 MAG: hypothetical protein COW12_09120 [Candidatus Omnitrophica bacterium CG12_big_fil_rev_8_21_14_0_65_45_16]